MPPPLIEQILYLTKKYKKECFDGTLTEEQCEVLKQNIAHLTNEYRDSKRIYDEKLANEQTEQKNKKSKGFLKYFTGDGGRKSTKKSNRKSPKKSNRKSRRKSTKKSKRKSPKKSRRKLSKK